MFENIINFFKKIAKKDKSTTSNSKDTAKERLHLVLMQDRANVSVDFLELMKQEIIDVIKKYIDVDESAIDVRLTNKENEDGTNGAPALYANIPILNIKNETRKIDAKEGKENSEKKDKEDKKEEITNVSEENKQDEEKDIEEKENKDKNETVNENEIKKESDDNKKINDISEINIDNEKNKEIDKEENKEEIKEEIEKIQKK